MNNPKISIIIVVYNDKKGLNATLQNIIELKYPNIEIIVVDGNSTDGTKDVIINCSQSISQWISEKDNGIYDAMNKGLRMSTGDYIWYINAGDFVFNPYTINDVFGSNDIDYDIYYGDTLIIDNLGNTKGLRKKRVPKTLSVKSFKKGMVVCHQSIIVRRSIAKQYDTTYSFSSDYKWIIDVVRSSKSAYNTNEILSVFSEGGATTQNRLKSLVERYEIMKDQFGIIPTIWSHIKFTFEILTPKYRKLNSKQINSTNNIAKTK